MATDSPPVRRAFAKYCIRELARTGLPVDTAGPRSATVRNCFAGDPATAVVVFIAVWPDGLTVRDCFVTGAAPRPRLPEVIFTSSMVSSVSVSASSNSSSSPSISSATRLPVGVFRGWPGGNIASTSTADFVHDTSCRKGVVGVGTSSIGGVTGRGMEAAVTTASVSLSCLA